MVAAIGALRGMEELQLMSHVDLLVSVSGGSWTAGPYMPPSGKRAPFLFGWDRELGSCADLFLEVEELMGTCKRKQQSDLSEKRNPSEDCEDQVKTMMN